MKQIKWQQNSLFDWIYDRISDYLDANYNSVDHWIASTDGVIDSAVEAEPQDDGLWIRVYQDRPLTEDDKQAILADIDPNALEDDDDADDDDTTPKRHEVANENN